MIRSERGILGVQGMFDDVMQQLAALPAPLKVLALQNVLERHLNRVVV
jgi:DNA-binding FrmR family transcriptional regulator